MRRIAIVRYFVSMLTIADHSRDKAGLTYVYPVISRRANGLSIGINLNPNNACNWRCIYCQVPDLVRGAAPDVDLSQLTDELSSFLKYVLHGDFYDRFEVPKELRTIRDIAISGNGEPSSAVEFARIVELIGQQIRCFQDPIKLVLITNGSLVHRETVQRGLVKLNQLDGEVWFKLDSVTDEGLRQVNNAGLSIRQVQHKLITASQLCPTWIQTCLFKLDGQAPTQATRLAYIDFLAAALDRGASLQGVLLYGLARPSKQPEAPRLSGLKESWLNSFAEEVRRQLGLRVQVNP